MCTLIVATRVFADTPLLVAANRDEALDRPAEAPTVRPVGPGGPRMLAPRDVQAGGTWIGLNEHGVLVAITNRFGVPVDPARPSRGGLVTAALSAPSAAEAYARMSKTDPANANGFHLVMADRAGAYLVRGDGTTLNTAALEPGIHVVTERSFGAAPTGREALIRDRLPETAGPTPDDAFWISILSARAEPTTEGVLVDWAERNYGTRSSTLVRLGPVGATDAVRFRHADGRPDRTPFANFSAEAAKLGG